MKGFELFLQQSRSRCLVIMVMVEWWLWLGTHVPQRASSTRITLHAAVVRCGGCGSRYKDHCNMIMYLYALVMIIRWWWRWLVLGSELVRAMLLFAVVAVDAPCCEICLLDDNWIKWSDPLLNHHYCHKSFQQQLVTSYSKDSLFANFGTLCVCVQACATTNPGWIVRNGTRLW